MKLNILFFFILIPFLYFSQRNNLITSQASYPVTNPKSFNKKKFKGNNTILFEIHSDQKISEFIKVNYYLDKNADYFIAYIINNNNFPFDFALQDGSLFIIQEAQNHDKEWVPIEHWSYSSCGNSYDRSLILPPKTYATFPVKISKGNYKTKIRLKMKDLRSKHIYYSQAFEGIIDDSKFKPQNWKKSDYTSVSYFDEIE
ncbi:hypothetical protein [Chryseobacterium taiwanense]|uniref:Uncharacterized protein n=1 Tax=Chryseobacterium taiwanense TaxID=363331 RepID=A0A0B4CQY7_9FLAO|nr:hypothetical protein [Chryseobacterium taiwanense]KIC63649.1 hypothetical protein RM51_08305 [Chryseobacterium taiwanense]